MIVGNKCLVRNSGLCCARLLGHSRLLSTKGPVQQQQQQQQQQREPKKSKLDLSTSLLPNEDRGNNKERFVTHPLFPHPVFTDEECRKVHFEHREPVTKGDRFVFGLILFMRKSFDFLTGYKKPVTPEQVETGFKGTRYEMTESKWLTRIIFLESIAGVPGMSAAFIRHLHSLRLLKRDKAWIESLLDEAYNERMHLLTFIRIGKPSWFTRLIIYIGQGVFCNLFFLSYLIKPKYCHRFVGYLEEEAVSTYSHLLEEIEKGKLPKFEHVELPDISWYYWTELSEKSSFYDLVQRVRADEAKHRELNHTLANLNQKNDRNPFAMAVPVDKPQPSHDMKNHKAEGWKRDDLIL